MTAPSKAERNAAIAAVVPLPGSAYTAWRQRLRHRLTKRAWAPHGRQSTAPLWPSYDALVARFGVPADERFAAVLNIITKARRQRYNAAYRARPQDDAGAVAQRLARAAYMRDYRARPRTEEEVTAERKQAAYMKRYRAASRASA